METKIIYTKAIAFELRKRGHKIIRTLVNENFPQYDCYEFEVNEKFFHDLEAITQKKK